MGLPSPGPQEGRSGHNDEHDHRFHPLNVAVFGLMSSLPGEVSRHSPLYTTPPFITNCTRSTAVMSFSGFPGTATTSA